MPWPATATRPGGTASGARKPGNPSSSAPRWASARTWPPRPARCASPSARAPPFLLLHGTADTLVPPRQSQRLADALTAAGAQATVELVDGAGHMFPGLDEPATTKVIERSVRLPVRHDHVGINVADLARAEAWYAAAFGLKREFATRIGAVDLDIVMLRHADGGHRVELLHRPGSGPGLRAANPAEAALTEGFGHLAFGVADLARSTAGCSASAPGR